LNRYYKKADLTDDAKKRIFKEAKRIAVQINENCDDLFLGV